MKLPIELVNIKTMVVLASVVLVMFYMLNGVGYYFPELLPYTSIITVTDDGREGWLELVEAALWFFAFIILVVFLLKSRQYLNRYQIFWVVFFSCMFFVALGEEISWGQHLGVVTPPDYLIDLNAQEELNLHNINLAKLLNIGEENIFYPMLGGPSGLTKLLNPMFYATCVVLWAIIPMLSGKAVQPNSLFGSYPRIALPVRIFVVVNAIMYLIVDKIFFDVAELLELALAFAALFVAFDIKRLFGSNFLKSDDV